MLMRNVQQATVVCNSKQLDLAHLSRNCMASWRGENGARGARARIACLEAHSRCTGYRPILDAFRVFAKGDSAAYTEEAIATSKGMQPGQNGHAVNDIHANGSNGSNGHMGSSGHGHNGSNGHSHSGSNGHANGNGASAQKPANGKNGKFNGQKVSLCYFPAIHLPGRISEDKSLNHSSWQC